MFTVKEHSRKLSISIFCEQRIFIQRLISARSLNTNLLLRQLLTISFIFCSFICNLTASRFFLETCGSNNWKKPLTPIDIIDPESLFSLYIRFLNDFIYKTLLETFRFLFFLCSFLSWALWFLSSEVISYVCGFLSKYRLSYIFWIEFKFQFSPYFDNLQTAQFRFGSNNSIYLFFNLYFQIHFWTIWNR